MDILIKDTTTIFQLAFGLNLISGIWISNFFEARTLFWKEFENTISEVVPPDQYNNPNLFRILESVFPDFKKMTDYCLLVVAYSSVTVIICFLALIMAIIDPTKELNMYMFILMSTFFLLVNPILYYFFNNYYKNHLSISLEVIARFTKENPQLILLLANSNDYDEITEKLKKDIEAISRDVKLTLLKLRISEFFFKAKLYLEKVYEKIT